MKKDNWLDEFNYLFVENGGVMPRHRDYGKSLARQLKEFILKVEKEARTEERSRTVNEVLFHLDNEITELNSDQQKGFDVAKMIITREVSSVPKDIQKYI